MKLYCLIFLGVFNTCKAQTIDKAYDFIKVPTKLVNSKPAIIQLTNDDFNDYFTYDYLNKDKVVKSDSLALSDMLRTKKDDMTEWTYTELPNTFIVKNNKVEFKNIENNVRIKDSVNNILKIRNKRPCEYGEISKEKLYSVSRPIFDKSKTLALVQYELLNCKNEGYISVKFYKKINNCWTFIDDIFSIIRQTICFAPGPIK